MTITATLSMSKNLPKPKMDYAKATMQLNFTFIMGMVTTGTCL